MQEQEQEQEQEQVPVQEQEQVPVQVPVPVQVQVRPVSTVHHPSSTTWADRGRDLRRADRRRCRHRPPASWR